MSRVPISAHANGTLLHEGTFSPAPGAQASIVLHGTATPVAVFTDEFSSGTLSQPLTADSNGQLPGWVVSQQALDVIPVGGLPSLLQALDASVIPSATSGPAKTNPVPVGTAVTKEAPVNPAHPDFGCLFDGTQDEYAGLASAATFAATASRSGGVGEMYLPGGLGKISAMLTIPDGVVARGEGASHQLATTTLQCTASGAGVTFLGRGGPSMGLRIDGNNVALTPWVVGAGLGRTFICVSVANSAQDGLIVNSHQNAKFLTCGSDTCTRDGLVLDLGAGGLTFDGWEGTVAGRYPLHIQQSGASPGNAYPTTFGPSNIRFVGGVFERQSADQPVAQIDQGAYLYFDEVSFSRGLALAASAVLYVADFVGGNISTRVALHSCLWGAQASAVSNIRPGQGQLVVLTGQNREVAGAPFIDASNVAAPVYVHDMPDLSAGGPMFTAGTPNNGQASVYRPANVHNFWQLAAGNLIGRQRVVGESFDRMQWFGSGTLLLGGGAGAPDTTLTRAAAGAWAATSGVFRNAVAALAQAGTVTPNSASGSWHTITVTTNAALTVAAPSLPPTASLSQPFTVEVFNNSGGAMGTITWNAAFVFAGATWTNPATGKRRFARFEWNGTNWICTSVASADY